MKSFVAAACTAAFVSGQAYMDTPKDTIDSPAQLFANGFLQDFMQVDESFSQMDAYNCFNGGDMIKDTMEATTYIRLNDYVRGYHKLYKYWNKTPSTVTDPYGCPQDGQVWSAEGVFGQWSALYDRPTEMAETVVTNYKDNEDLILAAVSNMEKFIAAGDYKKAGKQLSEVVNLGLGPFDPPAPADDEALLSLAGLPVPPEAIEPLVIAFFKELVYVNRLDSLSGCALDAKSIVSDVQEIIRLFSSGDEWAAITKASRTALKLKKLITDQCPGAPAELKALGEWFVNKVSSKQAMVDAASANSHIHSQEIYIHVTEVWTNIYGTSGFSPHNPEALGKGIADVAYWALGPVMTETPEEASQ